MEMSSQSLVSVVLIFLNAEQFIQEAIESVFAQTYPNWELLLVDDGSTDRSSAMARKYAEQHPERVLYLEHPDHQNFGKNASRNLGICYARGEYIAFLDADDVWMPHKLGQQVAILDSHPEAAMVYGLSQYWYSWTGTAEDKQRDFQHELGVSPDTLIKPPALISLFFLAQKAAIPNPSNILVRHEIIEEVDGFDEALGDYYEDQAFYAKVCLKAPVFAASECWNRYRQHPNSSSSIAQKTGLEYSSRLFFLNWLARYLSDQGVQDREIWEGLRKQLWRYRHPILFRSWRSGQHLLLLIARRTLRMRLFSWIKPRIKRSLISLLAKYNSRNGVFAVDIKSSVGLGAKLEWGLEILAYCHENGLVPQLKFSYPNSEKSEDYFGKFFRLKDIIDEDKPVRFSTISSITELNLGQDYDRILTIELATYLINKYLVVNDDVLTEVESFCHQHFVNRRVLGVHYRGTDKAQESPVVPYDIVKRNIDHYLKLRPETDCVFISSDDTNFIESMERASVGRPIIYRNDSLRSPDDNSIHESADTNKYEVNRDAIVNCLLLSRCDALLKTASILSGWSKLFNPKLPVVVLNQPYEQWFPERDLIRGNLFEPVA